MRIYRIVSKLLVLGACLWCVWTGYWLWTTPLTNEGGYFSEISYLGATPLVIPVLISLMALWSIFKLKMLMMLIATLLLLVFWLITGFSIGMAYTPALMLLGLACGTNLFDICTNRDKLI